MQHYWLIKFLEEEELQGCSKIYVKTKAYTYGSYSRVRQSRYVGTFKATASVRNMVTDSSVVEFKKKLTKFVIKKFQNKN